MANRRLNAIITIGGAVSSSLKSALGGTSSQLKLVGGAIREIEQRQKSLNTVMRDEMRLGAQASALKIGYASQELQQTEKQIDALKRKQQLLKREAEIGGAMRGMRDKLGGAAIKMGAVGAGAMLAGRKPLGAYSELDAATNNLEVAVMGTGGKLPKELGEIKKQTVELGNLLPGTTADFVNLATALKEQSVPLEAIVGGALKSAAHLAVVMKMAPEQAGELTAKLREAFQIPEAQFDVMADYVQRAKFGFGLRPDDLLLGAKYYGGKTNALGMTGAENVRKVYAIQGMAAQQGMDGSTFGTNFSSMLTRLGLMKERLNKNSKEMLHVNAELKSMGIQMDFFKDGKFAGVDNLVAQLGKLGKIKDEEKRGNILYRLFGEEGARPAELIARNGVEGYQKALAAMDAEAELAERRRKALESFKNQTEALEGSYTNLMAAIGEPIANMFKPIIGQLNEIIGGPMMKWVEQNQTVVQVVGGLVAGVGGLALVGAAVAAIGVGTISAALGLAALKGSIVLVGGAMAAVGRAMLLNPIGGVITVIAAGSLLIYEHWDKIGDAISKAGDKWRALKNWLGFGSPGSPAPATPSAPPPPSLGGVAAGRAPYQDNSQTTFQITQLPGQSADELTDVIIRKMKHREGVRMRSMMYP